MAAIMTLVVAGASPALAQQSRLQTKSKSTFTLDPKRQRVNVVVDIVITNRTPPSVRSGPCPSDPRRTCRTTTNYYTESWGFLAIQHGARNLRVRGPGVSARVANQNDTYKNYSIGFDRIQRGQTARLKVTYHLPAARARSGNSTRISPAYAHFCWHGQPTKAGSVIAILPPGYEPTTQHANVRIAGSRKRVKVTPSKRVRPGKFYACTDSLDTDEILETRTVSPSGQVVTVQGWPDDPTWTDAVTGAVEDTLPTLEELIGTPIPAEGLTIVEVASQALGGYAGDFSNRSGNVRVGEQADDPIVITHELAHAWFNHQTLGEKWMYEGAAEWVAREANGDRCDWRSRPVGDEEVPRLRKWRQLGPEPTDAERSFVSAQYFLACDTYDRMADLAGEENVATVIAALLGRTAKYGGSTPRKPPKPDWKEWLDAVEELGMAANGWLPNTLMADELVEAGIARRKDLAGRVEARTEYHRFLRGPRSAAMPLVVRDLMDSWTFDKAREGIAIADETMALAEAWDRANDGSTAEGVAARLAGVTDLKALRRLKKAVGKDPVGASESPRRE